MDSAQLQRSDPYRQVSRRVDAKRVFWAPDRSLHSCVVVVLSNKRKSSSHTPKSPIQWQLNRFGGASGTGSDLSTAPARLVARCVASKKVDTWTKTYVVFSTETHNKTSVYVPVAVLWVLLFGPEREVSR